MLTALAAVAALAVPTAPTGLARVSEDAQVALVGDHVLFTRATEHTVSVHAVPITGGPEQRIFQYTAPDELTPRPSLSASPQRAVLALQLGGPGSDVQFTQSFTGPPLGPWTELSPQTKPSEAAFAWTHVVDGPNLFTYEMRGRIDNMAILVHDPTPREIPLPRYEAVTARFAGDLIATTDLKRQVTIRNWRTGAVQAQKTFPAEVEDVALKPDGRLAAGTDRGVYGIDGKRITRATGTFDFAGDRLLFRNDSRLRMLDPDGRLHAFGTPTQELRESFATDDRHVAWIANRCLLIAPASAPAARTIAPGGPCPRSEIQVGDDDGDTRLTRTITFTLECVTAPRRCQGSVRLRGHDARTERAYTLTGRRTFSIPAGRSARIKARLTATGYRRLRAQIRRDTDATVLVFARTNDGDRAAEVGAGILISP